MKKLISTLLLAISMFSFFISINEYKKTQIFEMKNAEHHLTNSCSLTIHTNINKFPREYQYNLLLNVTKENNVSIYFSRIDQSTEKGKVIKYIYTTSSEYMDNIILSNGNRFDNNSIESNYFLANIKTDDTNQIGTIATLGSETNFEIKTLKSMVDDGMFIDGSCTISSEKEENIDNFKSDLIDKLKVDSIETSLPYDIEQPEKQSNLYIYVLYFILALLVLYDILKSYKKIAVQKLLGFSTLEIWRKRIFQILLIQIGAIVVATIVMSIVLVGNYNTSYLEFLKDLFANYFKTTFFLLFAASIPLIHIKFIKVSSVIKNQQPVKEILFFNSAVKISLLVVFISLVNIQVINYADIKKAFDKSYNRWDEAKQYVTLTLTRVNEEQSYSEDFNKNSVQIYNYFNERGAIFAAFSSYREQDKLMNKDIPLYNTYGMINPNYLDINPVYDINDNEVHVSEENENWVLLVPEQYKNKENEIKKFYQLWIDSYAGYVKSEIEIIWTKSNQKIFSYDFEVNSDEGNYVTDPVLFVGTENGGLPQWNSQIFNISGNPFKVKIEKGKTSEETVMPLTKQYGYSAYGVQINYANEQMASKTDEYKEMFKWLVTGISIILCIVVIILIQNMYNFFEQFKVRLAIRQFHGYGKLPKYKEYFALITISWLIVIISSLVLNIAQPKIIIMVAATGYIFEFIVSLIILNFIDKKNITNVIKGGL